MTFWKRKHKIKLKWGQQYQFTFNDELKKISVGGNWILTELNRHADLKRDVLTLTFQDEYRLKTMMLEKVIAKVNGDEPSSQCPKPKPNVKSKRCCSPVYIFNRLD